MIDNIEAILFDMGGTLRYSIPAAEATRQEALQSIIKLTGSDGSPEELGQLLSIRSKAYISWARRTRTGLDESQLWTQWMMPELPAERIAPIAVQLNQLWREASGKRIAFPETREAILELFRRGYRLGLVSNTTSSTEAPTLLKELQISGCFEVVLLSCQTGSLKPDPAMLLEAAGLMGVPVERCAYVGNRLDRDVSCAHEAGFASAILKADFIFVPRTTG